MSNLGKSQPLAKECQTRVSPRLRGDTVGVHQSHHRNSKGPCEMPFFPFAVSSSPDDQPVVGWPEAKPYND